MKPKDAAINFIILTMTIWHSPNDKNEEHSTTETTGTLNR